MPRSLRGIDRRPNRCAATPSTRPQSNRHRDLAARARAAICFAALSLGTQNALGQTISTQWNVPLISGTWTTPTRWTGGAVPLNGSPPGSLYNVLLPTGLYAVTLSTSATVNALTLAGTISPPVGPTLTITPTGELRSLSPIEVSPFASILLQSGRLVDSTINLAPGAVLSITGTSLIKAMTINGSANAAGTISINDGLTLNGTLTIPSQADIIPLTPLMLSGAGHLRGLMNQVTIRPAAPMTMTIGPQFRLDASVMSPGSTLINQGSMSPVANSNFIFTRFENNGLMTLNGQCTFDVTEFAGSGLIRAAAGASAQFASSFPELDSRFDLSQGNVIFRGTVNRPILADRRALTWVFDSCTVNSPTISATEDRSLTIRNGVTFNASAIDGAMTVAAEVMFNNTATRGRITDTGQTVLRFNGQWSNQAAITLTSGDFLVMSGSGVNDGPVTITNGSLLIEQQAVNHAPITVSAGSVDFRNTLTTDEFSLFSLPATNVGLLGTLENTGRTLALGVNQLSWVLGGRIRGGTIAAGGSQNVGPSFETDAVFEAVEVNRDLVLTGQRGVRLEGMMTGTGTIATRELTLANHASVGLQTSATNRVLVEGPVEITPSGAVTLSTSNITSIDPNNLGSINNRGTLAIVPRNGQNFTLAEFRSPGTFMTVPGQSLASDSITIENVKGTLGPIRLEFGDFAFRGPIAVADTVIFTDTVVKRASVTGRWRNTGLLRVLSGGVFNGRNFAINGSIQTGRLVEGVWSLSGGLDIGELTENAATIEILPGGTVFSPNLGLRNNSGSFIVAGGGGYRFNAGLSNTGLLAVRGAASGVDILGTLLCGPTSTLEIALTGTQPVAPITASLAATLGGTLEISSAPALSGPGIRHATVLSAQSVTGRFAAVVLPPALNATVRRYPTRVILTTCIADFDLDGTAGPDDLADFITAFFASPPLVSVDLDDDGTITPDDLSDFVVAYFAGCG